MIETVYFGVIACLTLVALTNWRWGIYLALFVDVARDPIRKLSDSQSVWMTVGGVLVWGGVFLGALLHDGPQLRSIFQRYPKLATGLQCLVLGLIPGTLLSLVLYNGGYKLALIGLVSYLAPFVGIAVGFLVPITEKDVYRIMRFYTLINAVALIGTIAEYRGIEHRVLGGMDMEWLRYQHGFTVNLIAGIYRSPDIMGLHAAHVVVFAMCLALKSREGGKVGWSAIALWGLVSLLLSGRRKMLGIPLVFVAGYLAIGMLRGSRAAGRLASMLALLATAGVVS